jgi:Pentapeptide repeats (8 copies)
MADFRSSIKKQVGQGICLFVLACLAYGLIWEVPRRQVDVSRDRLTAKEAIDAETAARIGWIQLLGGSFVAFGAFTTWKNFQENQNKNQSDAINAERNFQKLQEKQAQDAAHAENNLQGLLAKNTADRFSKAIEQLGNETSIHVRLGGIFALEQIANTEDKYYWQIIEILTTYVRERSPWSPPPIISEDSNPLNLVTVENPLNLRPSLKLDIQTAMTILARRKCNYLQGEEFRLNLRNTYLKGLLCLPGAKLRGIDFTGSNLSHAVLDAVDLQQAILDRTNLSSTELQNSILYETSFKEANLWNTQFTVNVPNYWPDSFKSLVQSMNDAEYLTLKQIGVAQDRSYMHALLPTYLDIQSDINPALFDGIHF